MAATLSAAMLKQKINKRSRKDAPKPGPTRDLYDYFMERRGLVIHKTMAELAETIGYIPTNPTRRSNRLGAMIEYLRSFYRLDIRRLDNGRWMLAGEWFGRTYVDYLTDELDRVSD